MKREIRFARWHEFPKYEIGSDGSVWSLDYNHTGERKQIKHYLDQDGYQRVTFVVDGRRHMKVVHRMVAVLFVHNPENKPQVNHKNGIRSDNRAENLEWCTSQENTIHGYRVNGRKQTDKQKTLARERFSGSNNPKAKANEATVLSIRRLRAKGKPLKDIAERTGLSVSQVSAIARGKFWANEIAS